MILPLKSQVVYGPVNSRRLGRSLGINVLPPCKKTCSFNCLYCQYGLHKQSSVGKTSKISWPAVDLILEEVSKRLRKMDVMPEYLTFSGHGEATLHPEFARIVTGITHIRDTFSDQIRTAILSNSSTAHRPDIRSALALLDERIMKLDVGNRRDLQRYNQPVSSLDWDELVSGLKRLKKTVIQTLFTTGTGGNLYQDGVCDWLDRLSEIRPDRVQIYTLQRGWSSLDIVPAADRDLLRVRDQVREKGFCAEVFN